MNKCKFMNAPLTYLNAVKCEKYLKWKESYVCVRKNDERT